MQITPSKTHVQEQALDDEMKVGDDENAKRERVRLWGYYFRSSKVLKSEAIQELRAQRRKSLLAAMDATPRHLTDPSTRKSAVLAGASKRREGSLVPGSPSKKLQPDSLHEGENNLVLGQSHGPVGPEPTLVDFAESRSEKGEDLTARLLLEEESDVSSAFEEAIEPVADALDVLKANVARARRESAVRAARLSHGGELLDTSAHIPRPLETFDFQNTAEGAETESLDLAGLLSTGYVEFPGRELGSSGATPTGEEGLEVDITEAQAEVTEVKANVTKKLNVAQEMKQETVDVEEEVTRTRRATERTPSPSKRGAAEQSPTRTTRGTKRSAAVEGESSVARRSTRRRVQEAQDDDVQDTLVEEAPRPLRRGRSATPAAQTLPDDTEPAAPTPSTRITRRAASETPRSASRSPSKSRSARGKLLAEPVIEEEALEDDIQPAVKTTVAPKPSKIAKSKAVLVRPPSRADEQEPSVRRVAKAKGAPSTSSTMTSTRPSRATATNPTAGPSTRVAGVVPRSRNNSAATTSAVPSKRTAGDNERQTSNNIGTRVKRSTRLDPDQGADDEEDSNPRKRRKAATVKEEEPDEALVPNGSLAKKTSGSRLPSALPTANRRAPTATKKTPSNRKGSVDHDKENTPETVQAEDQATGKASAGKAKAAKTPAATTRGRSVAMASNQDELAANSGGKSRRERLKK